LGIQVDTESFFVIVMIAALAAVTVAVVPRPWAPPVVVVELLLGIVVGPQVLDIAKTDDFIDFFSNLGLGMLFFFVASGIDFDLAALGSIGAIAKLMLFFAL
jgi:Kef-type K+ transport system membrane component KefB